MAISLVLNAVFIVLLFIGLALNAWRLYKTKFKKLNLAGTIIVLVAVVCLVLFPSSFHTVEAGQIAVVKHLGEARNVRTAGTYFDFWITEKYELYDAKVQNDSTDRRRVRIFWNAELGKLFSGYKDNSVKVKFTKVADLVYEIEIIGGEKEMTIKEQISAIESYIASEGFNYDGNLVENFYLSLKSKPFVILAGTSGTGKTRLVSLFAKAINAKLQIVPVRPDWSDSSDLFGHIDLSGHFKPGAIIDFIKDAYETKDTPFILCLDEMNLARVEYYMSDILSVIETRKFDISHRITSEKALVDENACRQNDGKNLYGEIKFPENLYIQIMS